MQRASNRLYYSIEKHSLDAHMIVEIFCVAHRCGSAADVNVQRRRAMRRKRNVIRVTQGCCLKKSTEPAAAGRVSLQDIDRPRFEHPPEVIQLVAVFASCDTHSSRCAVANQP